MWMMVQGKKFLSFCGTRIARQEAPPASFTAVNTTFLAGLPTHVDIVVFLFGAGLDASQILA
jgi:hypothetical protein